MENNKQEVKFDIIILDDIEFPALQAYFYILDEKGISTTLKGKNPIEASQFNIFLNFIKSQQFVLELDFYDEMIVFFEQILDKAKTYI